MWHYPLHHAAAPPTVLPLERYERQSPPNTPFHHASASIDADQPSHYVELEIRQQPKEALVTVDGKEKGQFVSCAIYVILQRVLSRLVVRKPVDPPPIVQLRVNAVADPQQ